MRVLMPIATSTAAASVLQTRSPAASAKTAVQAGIQGSAGFISKQQEPYRVMMCDKLKGWEHQPSKSRSISIL